MREVTIGYLRAFREFSPHAVAQTVATLAGAGFVEVSTVVAPIDGHATRPLDRWTALARRCLEWRIEIKGVDGALTGLYRGCAWRLYTRAGMQR